jgi:hypothetical protein
MAIIELAVKHEPMLCIDYDCELLSWEVTQDSFLEYLGGWYELDNSSNSDS